MALLVISGASAWALTSRHDHQDPAVSGFSSADEAALRNLQLPTGIRPVKATWSCQTELQIRCFVTDQGGVGLARALASALGARSVDTRFASATSRMGDSYGMCVDLSPTASAYVVIGGRPVNAVNDHGVWVVPTGVEPRVRGSVVTVELAGEPGDCQVSIGG